MNTGIWIARGLNDYNGGQMVEDDDTLMPMSTALYKGFEGTGLVYHTPESAERMNKIYLDQGIAPLMWGIPNAHNTQVAYDEGKLAGQLTASNGGIFVPDLEPSGTYWHGGVREVESFVEGFRQHGGKELRLCVDARNSAGGAALQIPTWESYAEEFNITYIPMLYYPEFEQTLETAYNRAVMVLVFQYGIIKSRIYPALANYFVKPERPMDGPTLYDSIKYVANQGHPGVSIFRRGLFTRESRDYLKTQPDPFANTTPPTNPVPQGVYTNAQHDAEGFVRKITIDIVG